MGLNSVVPTSMSRNRQRRRLLLRLSVAVVVVAALAVSLVSLAVAGAAFPDVPSTHPYAEAIGELAGKNIVGGYTNGNFGPNDPVKRQQFAKMAVLTGGYPASEADICPFADVEVSGPSTLFPDNYIAVCAAHGITTGKTPTTFDPYSYITRLQVVSMVVRMADDLWPGALLAPPAGWSGHANWTGNPTHGANAARAEYNGVLAGLDLGALSPTGNMTRGEVAQVLYGLLESLPTIGPPPSDTTPPTGVASYTITTSVPGGHGTITLSPNLPSYPAGTVVAVTAVPDPGYTFASWGGDASVMLHDSFTVVMESNRNYSATFTAAPAGQYALSTSVPGGGGTITRNPVQATYASGATVVLTAVPNSGYTFSSWGGDASGTTNPLTLVMNANKSISASFSLAPETPHYEDLGGVLTSAPAVCSTGAGNLEVFARGTDGSVMHRQYSGGAWTGWKSLGGVIKAGTDPSVIAWQSGRLEVFVCGTDNALWHKWTIGSGWSEWESLGGSLDSGPAAVYVRATTGPDFVQVHVRDSNGHWRMRDRPVDGDWGPWLDYGDDVTIFRSAYVCWGPGRVDSFFCSADNALWHGSRVSGLSQGEHSLGGFVTSSPAACSWGAGRLDVFVQGSDQALWHIAYDGSWSAWEDMKSGKVASAPAAACWGPNRIDVFVQGTNGALWHKWWDGSNWLP